MSIFDIFRRRKSISSPWEKYYDEEAKNVSIPNTNLYKEILKASENYPNNYAYEYYGKKVKYKSFIKKIDRVALSFKKLNIQKGDVVTICLPNAPEALISLYALNKLGAIASFIHPMSAEEEIIFSVNSTNSSYLIAIDLLKLKIKNILNVTELKKVILVSASDSMNIFMKSIYKVTNIFKNKKIINKYFISWNKFKRLSIGKKETLSYEFGKDTPAVILHSGGTTGTPKNVVIQNRSFILLTKQEEIILKNLKVGDSCLAIMPNFHGFGLGVSMHCQIINGIRSILVPQFDSKKFDKLLDKTKPSLIVGVPTLFEALIKSNNVKNLDLNNLKYIICGGDSLSSKLEDDINKYLKEHNCYSKVTQGYGLAEGLSAVTLCFDDVNKSGSIGIPLPGVHIKIISDATRKSLKSNEVGEICVHSKALMMGYLNDEKETNDALQIHDDGHIWLHTGDLGYMDEDGFLFYSGRKKRMIITSGYNVYPSHIENIIETHPAVLQCTVVGLPHPYKHEVPKAFIVLKEGYYSIFVKKEIKEFCEKNMAKYMIPKEFVYRKKLPKTKLGKVDFEKLKSDVGLDDI